MHKMLMLSSIAAILAGVALTFYFKSQESQVIESTYAYVSEAPIEIKALQPGKITFIAQHGQPVKKGELLLQTDAQLAISARQTAERSLAELEAGLHPYTIQIFNRLTRIPESATEITQELQLTRELHRQAGQLATSTSIRHASTQLELRKLELKKNRIAEDEARMRSLRSEDRQVALKLERERSQRDNLQVRLAALEQRLHDRKTIEEAFDKIPESQKTAFAEATELLNQINQAETELQNSKVLAPFDGIVIKTLVQPDTETFFGETCLILAATNQKALVTAFFKYEDATFIKDGMPCTVKLMANEPLNLTGRVSMSPEKESAEIEFSVPFQVVLDIKSASEFAKIQLRQEATIQISKQK